jgi:hypothetical protein
MDGEVASCPIWDVPQKETTMHPAIVRTIAAATLIAAVALSAAPSSAASLADVTAGAPLSGPIIVETRWLHPAESSSAAIVGVSDEPGCCHPDYVYAIRHGLFLGEPNSQSRGAISR